MKLICLILVLNSFNAIGQSITRLGKETGEYAYMLENLEKSILRYHRYHIDTLDGKLRNVFVPWIRDHIHVMKAMKFVHKDMTSFLEFFLEHQTPEGIFFDYYMPLGRGGVNDRMSIFDKRYWKILSRDYIQMHRLPVEADLEYLMVEGVYAVWQSTSDTAFVRKWLPALVKGMLYSMTDPLRWSKKHQLLKRGYTLDTWDFMELPMSREEFSKSGGNIQKQIFDIDEETPMGIMHGDNSGMYAACRQLSQMFAAIRDTTEALAWHKQGEIIQLRTNKLCWNGTFYKHFVIEDPMPPYLKMDQENTLSLSNPYNINRGLTTHPMARSIIAEYQRLKEATRDHSFAEWYGIYPAVQPQFAGYKAGSYVNGGVNTIVAGELAKAAFHHGFEAYGVDILQRIHQLMQKHGDDLPVAYNPDGKVDEGIPDAWGQAAVYSALIEGLAGVTDSGSQFSHVIVSPRWIAAGKDSASITVTYGPTGKHLVYEYRHIRRDKKISLNLQSGALSTTVRVLLPSASTPRSVTVDSKPAGFRTETVGESSYAVIEALKGSRFHIVINYR